MEFKEIKVAKLDEEDIKLKELLEKERKRIDEDAMASITKINLFWENLQMKHSLKFSEKLFIKNNYIYKRELS